MPRKNVIQFSVEVIDRASKQLLAIQSRFAKLADFIRRNATVILGALAVASGAFIQFANVTTARIDALNTFSRLTGETVEKLSELEFAATKAGISTNALSDIFQTLSTNISNAVDGTGLASDALRTLNLSASALQKLRFSDQLEVIGNALQTIENPTRRLAIATDIFNGKARQVVELLGKGTPTLRAYGQELDVLGGRITVSAAKSAERYQDALDNLQFAFQGLKVSIVDSGLIDGIADVTNAFARLFALLNNQSIAGLQLRIAQINSQLRDMRQFSKVPDDEFWNLPGVIILQEEIDKLIEKIRVLQKAQSDVGRVPTVPGADPEVDTKAADREKKERERLERFVKSFSRSGGQIAEQLGMLRKAIAEGLVPREEEQERIRQAILHAFDADVVLEELKESTEKTFNFMEEVATSAARNMQSALADYFFDPAETGLKGLLGAFLQVIRRMLAEMAAFQTLSFFNFGGFFDSILKRSSGGPAFGPTLVGERGPELVNLPRGSRVVPNSAIRGLGMGGMQFVTNIDARGADPGLIARLPQILENRDQQLKAAMIRYAETGIMPI